MITVLAETWTVTIAFEWMKKFGEEREGSTYTFASLRGCQEFIDDAIARGKEKEENKVLWYSIQGLQHIPCFEHKPWGQTFQNMIYHTYKNMREAE